jgi:hypothetical protein
VSLTLVNADGNELPVSSDNRFHLWIPRDPNAQMPPMSLQRVVHNRSNTTDHQLQFNYHYFSLQSRSRTNVSMHIEVQPMNTTMVSSVGYLLIYRFDVAPRLNSSMREIDGWSLLCPSSTRQTNEGGYRQFIDGQQHNTLNRRSIIIGVRQLNDSELNRSCPSLGIETPPVTDESFHFTLDYGIRLSLSACYFFDQNTQEWRSDGMQVRSSERNRPSFDTLRTRWAHTVMHRQPSAIRNI